MAKTATKNAAATESQTPQGVGNTPAEVSQPQTQAPVTQTETPTVDLKTLLNEVAEAAKGEPGYKFVSADSVKPLVDAGHVQINPGLVNEAGHVAARITEAGQTALAQDAAASDPAPAAATPAAEEKKEKPTISGIVSFLPPDAEKRKGGARPETYPFSQLEVGQSFFVVATEKNPKPATGLNSTVSSANIRYSEEDKTKPQKANRKGTMVYPRKQTRFFVVRSVDDGAPWSFPGKPGAVVARTL